MGKRLTKRLHFEIVLVILIALLPYSLYFHVIFEDKLQTLNFLGLTINHGFHGNDTFIWYISKKAIPLFLFFLLLLTCKFWWRYFILSPIFIFVYALLSVFANYSNNSLWHKFWPPIALTIMLLTLAFLLLYSSRVAKYFHRNTRPLRYMVSIKSYLNNLSNKKQILNYLDTNGRMAKNTYNLPMLFFVKKTMDSEQMIKENGEFKARSSAPSVLDISICLFFLILPFLYYLHKAIPEGIEKYHFIFLIITNNDFPDLSTYVWYMTNVLCILIPLIIWFVTERNWWKYAILSPIVLACYQFYEGFSISSTVDEVEFVKSLPFILALLVALFIVSYWIRTKYRIIDAYDLITLEIERLLTLLIGSDTSVAHNQRIFDVLRLRIDKEKNAELSEELLLVKKNLVLELENSKQDASH